MPQTGYCMFCGENICECNSKKKKSVPKKPTDKPLAIPAAPVLVDKARPTVTPIARPNPLREVQSQEDEELSRAITILADYELLHRDELIKHRSLIRLPSTRIDVLIWKQDLANGKHEKKL